MQNHRRMRHVHNPRFLPNSQAENRLEPAVLNPIFSCVTAGEPIALPPLQFRRKPKQNLARRHEGALV
jgi:hypothetical protein